MKQDYRKIHSRFKLNGIPFSQEELKEVAYSLIKEGEAFEKSIGDFLLDWLDDHSTLRVHTSGSTGKPKSITLQKQHMVHSALATGDFFGLCSGDSALLCLSADYIAGKMMLVRAMVLGLELDYVVPASNPLSEVSATYDFCAMVPLQLKNSMKALAQIKILIVGGAPLSDNLKQQVRAKASGRVGQVSGPSQSPSFSTAVFETYGMTETITHVAVKRVNSTNFGEVADAHTETANNDGQGLTHREADTVEVKENDNTSRPDDRFIALPDITFFTDGRGCLVIEAPKIADNTIVTNDMADLVSETEFEWLGRYDNVINSGGVKLFPEQIETKLAPLISSRFFVAGIFDDKLGQKLVLVIEGEIEQEKLMEEIRLARALTKFEVPKEVYCVSEFYETESGKIQRERTLNSIDSVG